MSNRIRLITFDALFTLIYPRRPIYVQYSEVFSPYFGTLPPESLKASFRSALHNVQVEKPVYQGRNGADYETWWAEVIRRTAIGAGADHSAVDRHLHQVVPSLLRRFSSSEGYALYSDVKPVLRSLNEELKVSTGLISNSDSRVRLVLKDLGVLKHLDPIILSDEAGVEKPSSGIFYQVLKVKKLEAFQCLHIGDELRSDYNGARDAGFKSLLLRRPEEEAGNISEGVEVEVVSNLWEVVQRTPLQIEHRTFMFFSVHAYAIVLETAVIAITKSSDFAAMLPMAGHGGSDISGLSHDRFDYNHSRLKQTMQHGNRVSESIQFSWVPLGINVTITCGFHVAVSF